MIKHGLNSKVFINQFQTNINFIKMPKELKTLIE